MKARLPHSSAALLAIFWLVFKALAPQAYASELVLQPDMAYRDLAAYVAFAEDDDHPLTLARAQAHPHLFSPLPGQNIDFGFTDARIWLRLELRNGTDEARRPVLAFNAAFMHRIDAWLVSESGVQHLLHQTEDSPFSTRPTQSPHLSAPFELGPHQSATLFVSYWSKGGTSLPLAIETRVSFAERQAARTAWHTTFYAIMAALIVFSLLAGAALRSWLYVLYGCYVGAALVFILHGDGLTFRHFWPDWPRWNVFASLPLGLAINISGGFFTRAFLDTRRLYPLFDKAFIGVIIASAAVILLGLFAERFAKVAAFPLVLGASLVFLAGGVRALGDKVPGALYYVIGWSSISCAALAAFLANSPLIAGAPQLTFDLVRVSILFDALMMALALLVRLNLIRSERDRLRDRELASLRANLDLTDRINALEQRLSLATAAAAAAGETLAGALHDLRQPLLSLRLSAQRLARDPAAAREAAQLETSLAYMEQLADAALAEAAKSPRSPPVEKVKDEEVFPAQVMLDALEQMFGEDARAKGLGFTSMPSRLKIRAQPTALLRILSNFAANAVRYTERGRILIGCRRRADKVWICVIDNGPGFERSEIARLMRAGERGKDAPGQGDGLGLAIAAQLADAYGYRVEVTSEVGKGAWFAICVPRGSELAEGDQRIIDQRYKS